MGDHARTLFCGNLSNKVTEDTLYELFLQAGPIEKVSIPKDRDGKQRTFGFITYKHMSSVKYALHLFEGTSLYSRTLAMKPRNNTEAQQVDNTMDYSMHNMAQPFQLLQQTQFLQQNQFLQPTQQLGLGNFSLLGMNSSNDDKNLKRMHPYQRDKYRERDKIRDKERDRNRDRDRDRDRNRERNHNDYYRDERPHYNRDNNYHSDHSRYNGGRKRWSYH